MSKRLREDNDDTAVETPFPKTNGKGYEGYACLSKECKKVLPKWGDALAHMKTCGAIEGKPRIALSRAKAKPLMDPFGGKLLTVGPPTEEELVVLVRAFLKEHESVKDKKLLLQEAKIKAIQPRYGKFKFGAFGFGVFPTFVERHGLGSN